MVKSFLKEAKKLESSRSSVSTFDSCDSKHQKFLKSLVKNWISERVDIFVFQKEEKKKKRKSSGMSIKSSKTSSSKGKSTQSASVSTSRSRVSQSTSRQTESDLTASRSSTVTSSGNTTAVSTTEESGTTRTTRTTTFNSTNTETSNQTESLTSQSSRSNIKSRISHLNQKIKTPKLEKTTSAPESKIIAVFRESQNAQKNYSKKSLREKSVDKQSINISHSESVSSKTSLKTYILADEAKKYMKSLVKDCVQQIFSISSGLGSEIIEEEKNIYLNSLYDDVVTSQMPFKRGMSMEELLKSYVDKWLEDVVQSVDPSGELKEIESVSERNREILSRNDKAAQLMSSNGNTEGDFHNSLRKLTSSSVTNLRDVKASSKNFSLID